MDKPATLFGMKVVIDPNAPKDLIEVRSGDRTLVAVLVVPSASSAGNIQSLPSHRPAR